MYHKVLIKKEMLLIYRNIGKCLFLLAMISFFIPKAHAIRCENDLGLSSITIPIITVFRELPADSIIYSKKTVVYFRCWNDVAGTSKENLYVYLNYQKLPISNEDASIGITTASGATSWLQNNTMTWIDVGLSVNGCGKLEECGTYKERKSLPITIVIKKKSPASSGVGKLPDRLILTNSLGLLTIEGSGGLNVHAPNFKFSLDGLSDVRYSACTSNVTVSPEYIDFGSISAKSQPGQELGNKKFSIIETRSCVGDTPSSYGVSIFLNPMTGTLSDDKLTLIPTDNNSVGIKVRDNTDGSALSFKEWHNLTKKGNIGSTREYTAILMQNKDELLKGTFSASTVIVMKYD